MTAKRYSMAQINVLAAAAGYGPFEKESSSWAGEYRVAQKGRKTRKPISQITVYSELPDEWIDLRKGSEWNAWRQPSPGKSGGTYDGGKGLASLAAFLESLATQNRSGGRRRHMPDRATIEAAFIRFDNLAVSLNDLNSLLREMGYSSINEEGARELGLSVRHRLSRAGKTRNIVVGLTPQVVNSYWAFASEKGEMFDVNANKSGGRRNRAGIVPQRKIKPTVNDLPEYAFLGPKEKKLVQEALQEGGYLNVVDSKSNKPKIKIADILVAKGVLYPLSGQREYRMDKRMTGQGMMLVEHAQHTLRYRLTAHPNGL